eukprot:CAMPEP_0114381214 /NCGR_PEP_ID=MMETSP0102-20121206/3319_1 /TAXON_ID=38822 ORGANISM="Pteridomonas danica, Strain PT" /NCGR_SAMPLE_ID=MMETSP0102 /ASSEMBLY_ACC=CAM_ASM_000212 /LENGTH=141 /DNA_ID=CAMNT_0001536659 /DNA_START=175 /DNA_END=600 /DNA_ORIENTATION=+
MASSSRFICFHMVVEDKETFDHLDQIVDDDDEEEEPMILKAQRRESALRRSSQISISSASSSPSPLSKTINATQTTQINDGSGGGGGGGNRDSMIESTKSYQHRDANVLHFRSFIWLVVSGALKNLVSFRYLENKVEACTQ